MKKKGSLVISLFLFQLIFSTFIVSIKAEGEIPGNYNQNLDLDEVYIYKITAFNTSEHLEWADLDWTAPSKGFANTTPGGQIKVNFTGFYEKNPSDFFNIFENPIPYMDIEFVVNRSGILTSNITFYNVSDGETAQNLLLGYNKFKSGFLIPTNSFSNLTQQAYAQDEPPFMNATVIVQETSTTISFEFKQKTFFQQRTICTYDKITGLLIYTNTTFGNYFLEMTLINLPSITINLPTPNQLFNSTAPDFDVTITNQLGINTTWYQLYNGTDWSGNFTFSGSTGKIDQGAWDLSGNGTVTIRFYANNSVGNIKWDEVIVRKDIELPNLDSVPSFHVLTIALTIGIIITIKIRVINKNRKSNFN